MANSNPLTSLARGDAGAAIQVGGGGQGNALAPAPGAGAPPSPAGPGGGSPAPPSGPGAAPGGPPADLETGAQQALAAAQAQYKKAQMAEKMLDEIKGGLDRLQSMGDSISLEDVMQEAGDLVGLGADPGQLAGMLATAPAGGQALAGWVVQQDQTVTQNELQIRPYVELARHSLGVAAMHVLMIDHIKNGKGQGSQNGGPPTASASPPGAAPDNTGAAPPIEGEGE